MKVMVISHLPSSLEFPYEFELPVNYLFLNFILDRFYLTKFSLYKCYNKGREKSKKFSHSLKYNTKGAKHLHIS